MDKTVIATFCPGSTYSRSSVWQWDTGLQLCIRGLDLTDPPRVHWGRLGEYTAMELDSTLEDGVIACQIPDELIAQDVTADYTVDAWVHVVDETAGRTIRAVQMTVKTRAKPDGYVSTPTEAKTWDTVTATAEDAKAVAVDAKSVAVDAKNVAVDAKNVSDGNADRLNNMTPLEYSKNTYKCLWNRKAGFPEIITGEESDFLDASDKENLYSEFIIESGDIKGNVPDKKSIDVWDKVVFPLVLRRIANRKSTSKTSLEDTAYGYDGNGQPIVVHIRNSVLGSAISVRPGRDDCTPDEYLSSTSDRPVQNKVVCNKIESVYNELDAKTKHVPYLWNVSDNKHVDDAWSALDRMAQNVMILSDTVNDPDGTLKLTIEGDITYPIWVYPVSGVNQYSAVIYECTGFDAKCNPISFYIANTSSTIWTLRIKRINKYCLISITQDDSGEISSDKTYDDIMSALYDDGYQVYLETNDSVADYPDIVASYYTITSDNDDIIFKGELRKEDGTFTPFMVSISVDNTVHFSKAFDDVLSTESENAVQNKVVKAALDGKQDAGNYPVVFTCDVEENFPSYDELYAAWSKTRNVYVVTTGNYNYVYRVYSWSAELSGYRWMNFIHSDGLGYQKVTVCAHKETEIGKYTLYSDNVRIDDSLWSTSERPVQNKVITKALAEKASITQLNEAIGNITSFDIDAGPDSAGYASLADLKTAHPTGTKGVFYLVQGGSGGEDNSFLEYFWTGTSYELAGKFGDVDTSALATKIEVEEGLAEKASTTQLTEGLAKKQDAGDYATTTELTEGLAQKADKSDIPAIPESLKNPAALTIKIGSTEVTYDGSTAQSITIEDGTEVSY